MNRIITRAVALLASFRTTILLMVLYTVLLGSATWIEKLFGTQTAKDLVYHAPTLIVLQILLVANFFLLAGRHHYLTLRRRPGLTITHFALVVILTGAAVTHFWGQEGLIHLREGETSDHMLLPGKDTQTAQTCKLPFSIRLDDFVLRRYPGSGSPSSYESFVTIQTHENTYDAHIYMNKVLKIDGYRLYQASYDPDELGSVLSVSHDTVGLKITYTGYALLFLGLILSFTGRNTRFRRLCRQLKELQKSPLILLFLLVYPFAGVTAAPEAAEAVKTVSRYRVSEAHANRFGCLPMQTEEGRMMPINTFASEILRKLYKENHFDGLNPNQFLVSLLLMPDVWAEIPLIALDNDELAARYGLGTPYTSFAQLFDHQGQYKLSKDLEYCYRKNPAQRNGTEKDLLKLDEQANIFHLVAERRLLRIFPLPNNSSHTWYAPGDDLSVFSGKDSLFAVRILDWYLEEVAQALTGSGDWKAADDVLDMIDTYQQARATGVNITHRKMETEVKYNRLNVFARCRLGYLILGGLCLLWAVGCLFGIRRSKWIDGLFVAGILAVFLFHMYGMGLRWYIGGYAPWSNSYETMVYVSWTTVLAGFLFIRRNLLVFALAALFGGVILFVAGLNWMDPQITTLVPVLKSPWLMFHVAVIVAAYGFFGLSCLTGISNMTLMCLMPKSGKATRIGTKIRELSIVNEIMLWIGLALMTVGTFLGAIWANESWGRYWGWDPKETWALVTMIIYALVTHIHLQKFALKEWLFNLLSVLAFSTVLMTFFGVNYFLSGMHSYGQNDHIAHLFTWIALAFGLILLLGFYSGYTIRKYLKTGKGNMPAEDLQ